MFTQWCGLIPTIPLVLLDDYCLGLSGFPTRLECRRRKGFGKGGGVGGNDNDSGPLAGSFELRNKSQLGSN